MGEALSLNERIRRAVEFDEERLRLSKIWVNDRDWNVATDASHFENARLQKLIEAMAEVVYATHGYFLDDRPMDETSAVVHVADWHDLVLEKLENLERVLEEMESGE